MTVTEADALWGEPFSKFSMHRQYRENRNTLKRWHCSLDIHQSFNENVKYYDKPLFKIYLAFVAAV